MKVSLSWLKDYISIDMNTDDLAEALTMAGLEVESVSDRYSYLNSVVAGRILEIRPHPKADKLKLCQVDIGNQIIPVVCGAPNTKNNLLVPCALPGTVFPNGTILEECSIRGEVSKGMLCSAFELGLGTNSDGIMDLEENFSAGHKLNLALKLSDPVLEIDLTPNRPDCLSIIGTALEIAAFNKTRLTRPEIRLPKSDGNAADFTSIKILDPDLCPRYSAQLVFNIKVAPSPFWLQDRLISVGLKPINNVVDITNFVMMETGQPLHAFDFDRLAENRIIVRAAKDGETFITLDQKKRILSREMLMICDGEKPVALAGVMGGLNSEIEQSTTKILIESAYFHPVCIRKTSKKTGLATDASHRFERGTDPNGTINALKRATQLIAEICNGKPVGNIIDEYPKPISNRTITLSVESTNSMLGTDLSQDDIEQYLQSIEFKVKKTGKDQLTVIPPSFRVDISRHEDLIEEVARLYGYNNIKTTFPLIPSKAVKPSKKVHSRYRIKQILACLGFTETITYSFINKLSCDNLELKADDPKRRLMKILNPITEDQSVLRTSLIPGMLETMHYNITRQNKNLKLFETGNVFFNTGKKDSQPDEREMLAGLMTGIKTEDSWLSRGKECDFYDIKGAVEELLSNLFITDIEFTRMQPKDCCYTKPGYTALLSVGNKFIGILGEVLPQVLKNYDLKQKAYIFEFDADNLIKFIPDVKSAKPLPRFPSTARDITLIVDKDIEALNIIKSIEILNEDLVESFHLFDTYEGAPIPADKKSISFRITYRSAVETLEDETINSLHGNITGRLIKEFDATLPA